MISVERISLCSVDNCKTRSKLGSQNAALFNEQTMCIITIVQLLFQLNCWRVLSGDYVIV
jgi:hypothetical protein